MVPCALCEIIDGKKEDDHAMKVEPRIEERKTDELLRYKIEGVLMAVGDVLS